ncbi:collagen adhesion protein [Actinoplanes sp. SE50]|nr:collagen adhesion protein [Actinoplanes sp. SE50]SLM03189.1 hypothetical protein ACSP50_6478 [Actinoplanes sp. SE50/110]
MPVRPSRARVSRRAWARPNGARVSRRVPVRRSGVRVFRRAWARRSGVRVSRRAWVVLSRVRASVPGWVGRNTGKRSPAGLGRSPVRPSRPVPVDRSRLRGVVVAGRCRSRVPGTGVVRGETRAPRQAGTGPSRSMGRTSRARRRPVATDRGPSRVRVSRPVPVRRAGRSRRRPDRVAAVRGAGAALRRRVPRPPVRSRDWRGRVALRRGFRATARPGMFPVVRVVVRQACPAPAPAVQVVVRRVCRVTVPVV